MPPLSEELIKYILGGIIAAVGAWWQWYVRPKDKKLSELEIARAESEKARLEAERVRDKLEAFWLARSERAEKDQDEANHRVETLTDTLAQLSTVFKELTEVVKNGQQSVTEEIRIIRATVERLERNR